MQSNEFVKHLVHEVFSEEVGVPSPAIQSRDEQPPPIGVQFPSTGSIGRPIYENAEHASEGMALEVEQTGVHFMLLQRSPQILPVRGRHIPGHVPGSRERQLHGSHISGVRTSALTFVCIQYDGHTSKILGSGGTLRLGYT